MLFNSVFSLYFPFKDGSLIGPEYRDMGGVADAIFRKNGSPCVHVEYKSLKGDNILKAITQGMKYLYVNGINPEQPMFSIYAKGNFLSFFLYNEHGHHNDGYGLKGHPYDGMFGLYVDLDKNKISILPQENTFFPQHLWYDFSKTDEYLRAECIMKFMSLYENPPIVIFDEDKNMYDFDVKETEPQKTPVQVFYKKSTDEFMVTEVDKKGIITYKKGLDLYTALEFANRPSDILTREFIANKFKQI